MTTTYLPKPTDPWITELAEILQRTPEEVTAQVRQVALIAHREDPDTYPDPGPGIGEPSPGMVEHYRDLNRLPQAAFDEHVAEALAACKSGRFSGPVDEYQPGDIFRRVPGVSK